MYQLGSGMLKCRYSKSVTSCSFILRASAASDSIMSQDSIAIAKKTARCAQYMGALKSLRVLTPHPATAPEIFNGLLFCSILRMCVQNLKFVALSVPEITGGTQKIWAVPVYAHAPFSPKFLIGFCSHGPSEYICQI